MGWAACPVDEGCLTQIAVSSDSDVDMQGNSGVISAVEIDPPGDPTAGDVYYESLEGMLVAVPMTGTVVGPTSFNTVQIVRGDLGIERVLRTGLYEGMPVGLRHYERYGDIGGSDAPGLIVGSTITNADGPLGYSYGSYLIITQPDDAWQVDASKPAPAEEPEWPAPEVNEFTAVSFNTLNFDGGAAKTTKVINSIAQLNGATFVALQEISVADVMTDVIDGLANLGYSYDYAYSHPDVGNHGVALIWRDDLVSDATWSAQYQACSPYGSSSSTAYDDYCDNVPGEYPLFSRRPVVLTATMSFGGENLDVIVIANHFKSKLGGLPSDMRRLEQGQFVAGLADDFIANNTPYVIVLGDLNDFEDAPPLQALYASGNLTTTWNVVPFETRFSYIFQGVSQILDHVLMSTALQDWFQDAAPLHMNADFPFAPYTFDDSVVWRTSDHDLVASSFAWQPQGVVTVTAAAEKDNTLYEDVTGGVSNGAGSHFFAGADGDGDVKRGVIAFDLSSIPIGSQIVNATLKLNMSRTIAGDQPVTVHQLMVDWGEGTSDAPGQEGGGTTATIGDATWLHTFYDTEMWTSAGGDFDPMSSAVQTVGGLGMYEWSSTGLVADVQDWVDDPVGNFGWLLMGNEDSLTTTKRFDTKDNANPDVHPQLLIEFIPAVSVSPIEVMLMGADEGLTGEPYGFEAMVEPMSTTVPLTLTWQATDQMDEVVVLTDTLTDMITYTWAAAGVKMITVTAENEAGMVSETHTITITDVPVPPEAGFTSNTPVTLGDMAVFTNTTTGTDPISYQWDFGDGSGMSTVEYPTYAYTQVGTYTVTLTATNVGGTDVVTGIFVVVSPTMPMYDLYLPIIVKPAETEAQSNGDTAVAAQAWFLGGLMLLPAMLVGFKPVQGLRKKK